MDGWTTRPRLAPDRLFGYEDEAKMEASEVSRAVAAATSIAEGLDLPVDDASVLHNSNKLALRLLPCDVFARVAHAGHELAQFEVECPWPWESIRRWPG